MVSVPVLLAALLVFILAGQGGRAGTADSIYQRLYWGGREPLSAFDYAMKIAETWKPGDEEKDNGVVFLTAVQDRQMFILAGYGVEGAPPDGRVGELRDTLIVPSFRQGNHSGGIRAGTEAITAILAAEYGVLADTAR